MDLISSIFVNSCICVVIIEIHFSFANLIIVDATRDTPEICSGDFKISSHITNVFSFERLIIEFISEISMAKDDNPLCKLSFALMRHINERNIDVLKYVAGTNIPDCAITVASAIDFIKELFPDEFKPYNNMILVFSSYFISHGIYS